VLAARLGDSGQGLAGRLSALREGNIAEGTVTVTLAWYGRTV